MHPDPLLSPLLKLMVDHHGSDLFLSVGAPPSVRIEGRTRPVGDKPLAAGHLAGVVDALLDAEQRETFESRREVNLGFSEVGVGRFRASVYHQRGEAAVVIRYVPADIPSLASLGLPGTIGDLACGRAGLVLVVGATGSGKSTTMASMVDHRNRGMDGHIVTIEDPIEFLHQHRRSIVDQREVGIDTPSYTEALAGALREAPDMVVIGEIRDAEAMGHALHFAETGHLVLATLHANNAHQTIERIVNFFPPDHRDSLAMDVSAQLAAVVSQRLVPTREGRRVAALEIMPNTPHVADLIAQGRLTDLADALMAGTHPELRSFDQSLFELWEAGRVEPPVALRFADRPQELRMRIEFAAPGTFSHVSEEDLRIGD